jgi:hypothetical protein
VPSGFSRHLWLALGDFWREQSQASGPVAATSLLLGKLWAFLRESTPGLRRQRYGDMEYDWDNRVNTTSGTISWRARLLGVFHSPYQPTEPTLFREMVASLPIEFDQFTFIDIGSGKGRTLLMASDYPFRKILGVELIAELHQAAEENIRDYRSPTQRCAEIKSVLANARDFELPVEPLVLYFFNPLTERTLSDVLRRLENSLVQGPRPVWLVYHNPALEPALAACGFLQKYSGTSQYSVYRAAERTFIRH